MKDDSKALGKIYLPAFGSAILDRTRSPAYRSPSPVTGAHVMPNGIFVATSLTTTSGAT
ncbi:MAG: hypothetical protein ABI969_17870 [bacterium]